LFTTNADFPGTDTQDKLFAQLMGAAEQAEI
jgi:hypothetical protein